MYSIFMEFYATKTPDGLYHVQNFISGLSGQHHVHTKEGFESWAKDIKPEYLHVEDGKCDCGMKPGDVTEYDGRKWHNDRFEAKASDSGKCLKQSKSRQRRTSSRR
jgi:hypothetical protein